MDGLWLDGLTGLGAMGTMGALGASGTVPGSAAGAQASNMAYQARDSVRELSHQVERLSLLNQALWELLRERAKLTDADLLAKAKEIDLRDGQEDNAISKHPVRCPSCKRVCNSKHFKCIYCGQEFERTAFG